MSVNESILVIAIAALAAVVVRVLLMARRKAAQRETERLAAEEAARVEAERLAAEEAARVEAERLAAEEAARVEAERLAAEEAARVEAERLAAEEAARVEAERLAAEEAARVEAERLAAEEAARVEAERLAAEEAAASLTRKVKPAEQIVVMLADDSKVVRVKTGRLLAAHHFQVATAEDGLDAAHQIENAVPDLLITDVDMPGMGGLELVRHVRASASTVRLPVIMITSDNDRLREEAMAAGVNVVLGKPYAEEQLIAYIHELVNGAA